MLMFTRAQFSHVKRSGQTSGPQMDTGKGVYMIVRVLKFQAKISGIFKDAKGNMGKLLKWSISTQDYW